MEVLGTVLGTAIQGQIVGGASNCPNETDVIDSTNLNKSDVPSDVPSDVTLDETVSPLSNIRQYLQLFASAFT